MKSLVPIEKNVKISQKIVEQIKGIILSGGLQPGDRLPKEQDLSEMLGVSRPTLREALTVLEAIGLIEVRPREGSIVRSVVPQSIQEPIQAIVDAVRRALEITPPELSSDIVDKGIMMTGGGALIRGLDKLLNHETNLPIHVDEEPLTCVVRGGGRILDDLPRYRGVLSS